MVELVTGLRVGVLKDMIYTLQTIVTKIRIVTLNLVIIIGVQDVEDIVLNL